MKDTEAIARGIAQLFHPSVEVILYDEEGCEMLALNRLGDGVAKEQVVTLKKGAMRLRFDTTAFVSLQAQLEQFLDRPSIEEETWQERTDRLIADYLRTHQITLSGASRAEKQGLVLHLHEQGVFDHKQAAAHIAQRLNTSRATIYNYLKWASTVAALRVHQVDAFTKERFGGNPAGVVLDAELLADDQMRKIARELNLSETSFVLPSNVADYRLRYFTPTGHEVPFCGHSSVGAFYMLAHEWTPGSYKFVAETGAGKLPVTVTVEGKDDISVAIDVPPIRMKAFKGVDFGIPAEVIADLPLMVERTNRDLYVPIKSLADLEQMEPDLRQMESFCRQHDLVAVCALTSETIDEENQVHSRCFAPAVGIPEDPFTGSVQGGLVAYLRETGLVPKETKEIGSEQGHFMGRPGSVRLKIREKEKKLEVTMIAHAVHAFSTEMKLV